jgi:Zn-dependent protease
MRKGHLLVAAAGPLMNVAFALVIALISLALIKSGVLPLTHRLHEAIRYAIILNFVLFIFNLIPAPPLDGGAVVAGIIPESWVKPYEKLSVYGPFLLMAIIFIPGAGSIFMKPAMILSNGLFSLFGLPYAG